MKHPQRSSELYEFNLGKTPELRCVHHQSNTICGECESCLLTARISLVKEWFSRAGDKTRKRFVFGLINRSKSRDLLKNVMYVLHPLASKDFTYASSRTTPGLGDDFATASMDRALDPYKTQEQITEIWKWYEESNYWTKSNFLMITLTNCEPHLLNAIHTECKRIIMTLDHALQHSDDYEAGSVDSSRYTFDSSDHPELDILTSAQSNYDEITRDPFTPFSYCDKIEVDEYSDTRPERPLTAATTFDDIINDSGDETLDEDDYDDMVDPINKCDFIRHLPVYLSKLILSMLDFTSLSNCVCVSRFWRALAEEVFVEHRVGQSVREEVMLMQGSGAQGYDPKYAADIFVAVPNVHVNSFKTVRTREKVIETYYRKSEISFSTAYSGYSTRNIIMEERNVYCGAYNVLVLSEKNDPHRVIHTEWGNRIAIGSRDNKLRFLNIENGKNVGRVISGHAGTISCIILQESTGCVYSGSYDTSIRCWSLETGKCLKIFRSHYDTVNCINIHKSMLVSGGKDKMCKLWDIQTKKCLKTFRHKAAITAVALSDELCVSGCEGARVKVWDIASGKRIKRLTGHQGSITAIQLDRWHIVTGSKDGYVLVWSTQGDHTRCLVALRHPKEVLCLEFMYLRVITGAADGKVRIWNIITGQCLRIMRGNSNSDPINRLIAIDNRITLNTAKTLLVLNFEPIELDYFLESDRIPPRVRYSNYGDSPIRNLPYPYVRARRMKSAGASNKKIVKGDEHESIHFGLDTQTPHSGKGLSRKSMSSAKRIQSAQPRVGSVHTPRSESRTSDSSRTETDKIALSPRRVSASAPISHTRHRASIAPTVFEREISKDTKTEDSDDEGNNGADLSRRVSWGFDGKFIPDISTMSLGQTKNLLRSQMRSKGGVVPPDFIYLAVNAIQASMKSTEACRNMEDNRRAVEMNMMKRFSRPGSGPCHIDPRTKVPVDSQLREQIQALVDQGIQTNEQEMMESRLRIGGVQPNLGPANELVARHLENKSQERAKSAGACSRAAPSLFQETGIGRPRTAPVIQNITAITKSIPNKQPKDASIIAKSNSAGMSRSYIQVQKDPVPMLMYSNQMREKLQNLKIRTAERTNTLIVSSPSNQPLLRTGKVSEHNDPFRRNVTFKLRTHNQVNEEAENIIKIYKSQAQEHMRREEVQKRKAWHTKVKETMKTDKQNSFQSKMATASTAIR